ncbi:MAG: hypothetical protein KAI79_11915 [Bacteroidales bacterium]|nr:hypothetical protein [Bacteroidales bacterium]
MNKIFLIVTLFLINIGLQAQPVSMLNPDHVEWEADNQAIFLPTAFKNGIKKPDSLSLILFFSKNELKKFDENNLPEFEFQWYRYPSTKRFFVKSVKGKTHNTLRDGKYYIAFESTISELKTGWWEVQVISYSDNGIIEFNSRKKFQILLK